MFEASGILVTRDDSFYMLCSSEDMADRVAYLANLAYKVEVNERTRRAYNEFVSLRDATNTAAKVA